MNTFETLYERDAKGKLRVWNISVSDKTTHSEITVVHGTDGGKQITKVTKVLKGKNIGKTNATTHYTQALADAKGKWDQKNKQGYTNDRFSESKTKYPMLAKEFTKNKKKVVYPCLGQPKIDGVRCVYNNGEFRSRMGKKFFGLSHIKIELSKFGDKIIDGELYSYEMNFNKLVGLVKSETLSSVQKIEELKILFVAYDVFSHEDYSKRLSNLSAVINGSGFKYVKLIRSEEIHTEEEINMFHKQFVSEGYEGIMIRNKKGAYDEKKRSNNLLKYKHFFDEEYKITGFTSEKLIEKGKEMDLIVWECEISKGGQKFHARPQGCFEDREKMYKIAKKYIGCLLTVKYQELTPDGIPRFPVGVSLRGRGKDMI